MITENAETGLEIFAGIDTHKNTHVIATCDSFGKILLSAQFSTTNDGIQKLTQWLFEQGSVLAVGIEGTGSYGKNVTVELQKQGIQVFEVTRAVKSERRVHGKSDFLDAQNAARCARDKVYGGAREHNACIAKDRTSELEEIRVVKALYDASIKMRTQAVNDLKAAIISAPASIRESLIGLSTNKQIAMCLKFRSGKDKLKNLRKSALKSQAEVINTLDKQIKEYKEILDEFANKYLKNLLEGNQIGTISAIQLLLSAGANADRFKSEAAFAMHCGVAPVPASSGMHSGKMRLSRAGDRKANSVLHMIAIGRMGHNEETKKYVERRVAEGKSKREIIRILKRYIAREAFRRLKKDLEVFSIAS